MEGSEPGSCEPAFLGLTASGEEHPVGTMEPVLCRSCHHTQHCWCHAGLYPNTSHLDNWKNPLQLLICWSMALRSQDLLPICILLQGFSSFPNLLQQQLPTALRSNPGFPLILLLPEGFTARLSGQDHLCQLLVGFTERWKPASVPLALFPPPCPVPVGRGAAPPALLPWKQRSAQPWAASQRSGERCRLHRAHGAEPEQLEWSVGIRYGKGNCCDRERLPEINTGARQQPQTRLSLRRL